MKLLSSKSSLFFRFSLSQLLELLTQVELLLLLPDAEAEAAAPTPDTAPDKPADSPLAVRWDTFTSSSPTNNPYFLLVNHKATSV